MMVIKKRPLLKAFALTALSLLAILAYDFSYQRLSVDENLLAVQGEHLEVISREPHPVGSEYHTEVGDYIREQINSTETFTLTEQEGRDETTGIGVRNIMAFKDSPVTDETIVISAHYDSEAGSFGANDDGLAIASMLTLIQHFDSQELEHNLLLFYTDAEEQNLAGARYFVDNYGNNSPEFDYGQLARIYNFEARGGFGPIFMFEAVNSADSLTAETLATAGIATNHSVASEVYERLPNQSDLTVLKNLGVPGYNFGYFRGLQYYHTPLDNFENTSSETREQQLLIMSNLITSRGDTTAGTTDSNPASAIYFSPLTGLNLHVNQSILVGISSLVIIAYLYWQRAGLVDLVKGLKNLPEKSIPVNPANPAKIVKKLGLGSVIPVVAVIVTFLFSNLSEYYTYPLLFLLVALLGLGFNYAIFSVESKAVKMLLNLVFLTLGVVAIFFSSYLYLVSVVTIIAIVGGFLSVKLTKFQFLVQAISAVLVVLLISPSVLEFAWIYDNRLITLLLISFLLGYQALANSFQPQQHGVAVQD